MDIEHSVNTTKIFKIFTPIAAFSISNLYQQQITLENTFASPISINSHDILLTLINNTLLISNPMEIQIQPIAAINLTFDVKF